MQISNPEELLASIRKEFDLFRDGGFRERSSSVPFCIQIPDSNSNGYVDSDCALDFIFKASNGFVTLEYFIDFDTFNGYLRNASSFPTSDILSIGSYIFELSPVPYSSLSLSQVAYHYDDTPLYIFGIISSIVSQLTFI